MNLLTTFSTGRVVGVIIFLVCFGLSLIALDSRRGPAAPWRSQNNASPPPPPQLENNTKQPSQLEFQLEDTAPSKAKDQPLSNLCSEFPDPGNVAIAVKTGATEATERVPMLMLTSLQCAQNVMIFSDLEQDIAGYHIHDALEDIPQSAMEGNSDFDFYLHLKEAKKYGQIDKMLKNAHDPRHPDDLAAWTLDKYKFLHVLEKLYAAYPDKDWYFVMEADTYLIWPNLVTWLPKLLDPRSHKLYLGSVAMVADTAFAHGGSGFLLSQATMHELAVVNRGVASAWDIRMHEECCGDYVVAAVLKKMGIPVNPAWPTINGEKPSTLPFGPSHWCQPVVTMHHVNVWEMNQISHVVDSWNATMDPLLFADLFNAFMKDIIPDTLSGWNSISNDLVVKDVPSAEQCGVACKEQPKCFQYAFNGKQCFLGYSMHLGTPVPPNEANGILWESGWMQERIKNWLARRQPCQTKFPWERKEAL